MTVTIFGATGMVGKYLVRQALANEHKVIAFGRNIEDLIDVDKDNDNLIAVKGYVLDDNDVLKALKGSDAVLSALGGGFDGTDKTRSLGIKNIIEQMAKASVSRIIAIGGQGVLNADENSLIIDSPEYPQQYLPVGREHLQAYNFLHSSDLNWTFVCPPNIKDEDADEKYTTIANYHPENSKNEVKAGNITHFILSELNANNFIKLRVGIADVY
jgi:putative NADH-flavin reductase